MVNIPSGAYTGAYTGAESKKILEVAKEKITRHIYSKTENIPPEEVSVEEYVTEPSDRGIQKTPVQTEILLPKLADAGYAYEALPPSLTNIIGLEVQDKSSGTVSLIIRLKKEMIETREIDEKTAEIIEVIGKKVLTGEVDQEELTDIDDITEIEGISDVDVEEADLEKGLAKAVTIGKPSVNSLQQEAEKMVDDLHRYYSDPAGKKFSDEITEDTVYSTETDSGVEITVSSWFLNPNSMYLDPQTYPIVQWADDISVNSEEGTITFKITRNFENTEVTAEEVYSDDRYATLYTESYDPVIESIGMELYTCSECNEKNVNSFVTFENKETPQIVAFCPDCFSTTSTTVQDLFTKFQTFHTKLSEAKTQLWDAVESGESGFDMTVLTKHTLDDDLIVKETETVTEGYYGFVYNKFGENEDVSAVISNGDVLLHTIIDQEFTTEPIGLFYLTPSTRCLLCSSKTQSGDSVYEFESESLQVSIRDSENEFVELSIPDHMVLCENCLNTVENIVTNIYTENKEIILSRSI